MSEPKSPLAGAKYEGFVKLATMGLQGMITLRGDLGSEALGKAVKAVTGVDVPAQRRITLQGEAGAAWMSPDELLLLVPYADVAAALERLHDMLVGTHFLAVDVSDARVMFRLEGQGVREVVAKLMPVDMRKEAFGEGEFRRSRMAQIPAAIWMPGVDRVQIICFRSVAEYAFNLLKGAAAPGGEVGHLA